MIHSLSHEIKMFFDKKKKVLEAVKNYYSGRLNHFPYTYADIRETKSWLLTAGNISQKDLFLERLTILEAMTLRNGDS